MFALIFLFLFCCFLATWPTGLKWLKFQSAVAGEKERGMKKEEFVLWRDSAAHSWWERGSVRRRERNQEREGRGPESEREKEGLVSLLRKPGVGSLFPAGLLDWKCWKSRFVGTLLCVYVCVISMMDFKMDNESKEEKDISDKEYKNKRKGCWDRERWCLVESLSVCMVTCLMPYKTAA